MMPTLLIVMGRYVTHGSPSSLNSGSPVTTARIGDPTTHRRVLGPLAARRLDARIDHLPGDAAWRPLDALGGEADGAFDAVVTVGAFCAASDLDAAVALVRRVLVPGGQLHFVEHVGRVGALGAVQRAADRLWSSLPQGCHVGHDLPAALRRGGFVVSDLERTSLPSAVPLLRPWVQGVARSHP
jgi:SAM-dependent methyltransferase